MKKAAAQEAARLQDTEDAGGIALEKAGIREFRMPLVVFDPERGKQHVTATINIYTSLDAGKRGVHLSGLMAALHSCSGRTMDRDSVRDTLEKARGGAERAFIEMEFLYFREKEAPVSKTKGFMGYKCRIIASLGGHFDFGIEAEVPVMTLCPHSKELSGCSAHNQRSIVTIRAKGDVWFDDLIKFAEEAASGMIYTIFGSADEKHIMEKAYENPKLAEDVVRDIAAAMKSDKRIRWFHIAAENFDSNRSQNVYAETGGGNN